MMDAILGFSFTPLRVSPALASQILIGSVGFIAFIAVSLFAVALLKANEEHGAIPSFLPWVGKNHTELFSSVRANLRGTTESNKLFRAGFEKYSRDEKTYVVPTWTKGPQVIVPPSMISWLGKQKDDKLHAKSITFDNMQFKYTVQHPEITHNDMLDKTISRDLTRSVGTLNKELMEEIALNFEQMWGTDTENWNDVGGWDSMIKTIARTANRIFVGPELSGNDEYITSCVNWTRDIQISGAMLHLIPNFLKSTLAWFITIPNRKEERISMKHTLPLVQERIKNMERKRTDPDFNWEEPNDTVTWLVRDSFQRTEAHERNAEGLAYRLLLLNFAAVSTSAIGVTSAVFDIFSTDPKEGVVEGLREEAARILRECNGVYTKAGISKLVRLDSAIRESMRISGVGGTGLGRKVRPAGGLTLDNGLWLPPGVTVGVSQSSIHMDEKNYPDAARYDAFRFSRDFEEESGGDSGNESVDSGIDMGLEKKLKKSSTKQPLSMVNTSETFLAFSHGRHACPGRFFAENQLKLVIAHLVLNYDVEHIPVRPDNTPLGDINLPPLKATLRVRRRKAGAV